MHHQASKRRKLLKLIAVYIVMIFVIFVTVITVVYFVLGYRFDVDKGRLEQYSFMQFGSSPAGASVVIDGIELSSKTPNKSSVKAGKHSVTMKRDGYNDWNKTIDLKAGTLTWLSYALFVPKKLNIESVATMESLSQTSASPKGHYMLAHKDLSLIHISSPRDGLLSRMPSSA